MCDDYDEPADWDVADHKARRERKPASAGPLNDIEANADRHFDEAEQAAWDWSARLAELAEKQAKEREAKRTGHYDDCECRMCHERRLAY